MAGCATRVAPLLSGLYRAAAVLLAVALLGTGFAGRAGVQVLDGAIVARLLPLHLHGVPGEAEYVRTFGVPAPFVHPHCHDAPAGATPGPGPDEVQAAAALAGAVWCAAAAPAAPAAPAALPLADGPFLVLTGISLSPLIRPPRAA
jgi:hypothetical protein